MANLHIPDTRQTLRSFAEVQAYLNERGVWHDRWEASQVLRREATQEEVLTAYEPVLRPYMEANGYQVADVINIYPEMPNLAELRNKFLAEHTHTEDEVRFFVAGCGYFWFHLEGNPVFCVKCEAGDLISVPAHTRHWFDLEPVPYVKAIRIFIDPTGWVPHYTGSDLAQRYQADPKA